MVKGLLCGLCQTLLFYFQTYHVKWSVDLQHQRQVMGKVKYSIYLKNYCITFEYLPMSVCDFTVLNWAVMVSYKTDIWYSKMIDWCLQKKTIHFPTLFESSGYKFPRQVFLQKKKN